MPGLLFTLTGRDELSDVFDDIGRASLRLRRRISSSVTEADREMRRLGRTSATSLAGLRRDSDAGAKAVEELGKVTSMLWPAAIPAAASLAPLAAGAGTVAVAMGAMAVAMKPQIAALGEASEAQKAYDDAVTKSGARSQEAVAAQVEYYRVISQLPPKTREAAVAVGLLKDDFADWSDELAGDTMAPFIKGVQITNALLPKTSGLVRAASDETDRFMTIVGAQVASPGLDRLNSEFTTFADKTLRKVNDEIVHMLRVSDSGEAGGPAREFMTWARAQGPTVASVLNSVATSLIHVLDAGSDVGVGLLDVVEVVAGLVSAVPAGAIALFLQLALALKVTKAAALGMAAGRTALAAFGTQVVAMNTAAAATPGRLAAVRAGIMALSRTTKLAMAGTGIGLLVIALTELSQRGRQAPPDVDKLTASLKELGSTGKVTGEASKHFGADLDGLHEKIRALTDPSDTDKVQQWLVSLGGLADFDSTPVKEAKENVDSIDKALANLVSSGQSDLAAAALKRLTTEYGKGGRDTKEFTGKLNDYKTSLADAKFEQQLAADSMGIFGTQAQAVQEKLNAQKLSADGLRQSIIALSETHRNAFDAETKFEAAVDAATKALETNGRTLDKGSEKGRANRDALSQLASATEDAATKARENGASWETVAGIYDKGRKSLVENATAMGGSRSEAEKLASTLLTMPSPKLKLEMEAEDAKAGLTAFNAALKASPDSKSVTLKTLSKSAEQILEGFGYKVKRLPDGSVTVTANAGRALSNVRNVAAAIAQLHDKSITIFTKNTTRYVKEYQTKYLSGRSQHDITGATGGLYTGSGFAYRGRGYSKGGLVEGPGTTTSDDVFAPWLSAKEFVVNAFQTARNLPLLKAINSGRFRPGMLAAGSGGGGAMAGMGEDVGRGLAAGMLASRATVGQAARVMASEVEAGIRDELEIRSPSKKTKALAQDIGKGLIVGMTGTRDKIKSTAADLAKDIRTAFSGKKESGLLRMVDRETKKLLGLAAKRDKIAATIAAAKDYRKELTGNAREGAGLSSLGMAPEEVTAGGIKAGLAGKLAQIRQFTRYIGMLAKRGLSKDLLRQVLNMGPEQGYAYASALVGADKATFNSINSLQTQIGKGADQLGATGADILYDSGKNAAKGFLTGLTSQEAELDKAMQKVAKAMQKALRKALGIRSPARKVIPDGINTTRGLAVGVLAGLPYIDKAMDTVAGRMAGRAAIAPTAGRPAVVGGGGGGVMQVNISVTDARDPVAVAMEIRKQLLQLKRDFGLNVELKVG